MWLLSDLLEAIIEGLADFFDGLLSMAKLGCRGLLVLLLVVALIGLGIYWAVS